MVTVPESRALPSVIAEESVLKNLLQNIPAGIVIHGPDTGVLYANPRALSMLGLGEDRLFGRSAFDPAWHFVGEDGHTLTAAELPVNMVIASHKALNDYVVGAVRPQSGETGWAVVNAYPEFDAAGVLTQVVVTFIDITARIRSEALLRDSEEKYKVAFRTSPDSININALDGTYIDINDGFTALTGYTREDVIGVSSVDIHIWERPEDRTKLLAGLKHSGKVENLESVFRCKDGSFRTALMSARIITLGNTPHILSITRDITEKQKMLEEIQRSEKLESVGVLAGGIAHDFNNLLGGLFGYIDLAHADLRPCRARMNLEAALSVFDRAKGLTQQLLTFSKGGAPSRSSGLLEPLLRDCAQFMLSGSNVAIRFDIAPDLPSCDFDPDQMAQVIDNLVINAQQAMPQGGQIVLSAHRTILAPGEIAVLNAGEYISIFLTDTGGGIPLELQSRIFDPFFTTKTTGSGLGLATAYSIIRRHDGHLSVDSSPGGTTFRILLPVSHQQFTERLPKSGFTHQGRGHILVMDDESFIVEIATGMAENMGYSVVGAADGDAALQAYVDAGKAGKPFDMVITDLTVPGGTGGRELLAMLRGMGATIPIVASSGYSQEFIESQTREYRFTDTIGKPYRVKDLADLLERHFGNRD